MCSWLFCRRASTSADGCTSRHSCCSCCEQTGCCEQAGCLEQTSRLRCCVRSWFLFWKPVRASRSDALVKHWQKFAPETKTGPVQPIWDNHNQRWHPRDPTAIIIAPPNPRRIRCPHSTPAAETTPAASRHQPGLDLTAAAATAIILRASRTYSAHMHACMYRLHVHGVLRGQRASARVRRRRQRQLPELHLCGQQRRARRGLSV